MDRDIYHKLAQDFGSKAPHVQKLLLELDTQLERYVTNRLKRAIIYLANGKILKFHHLIKLARIDYRDVLWQAEYDDPDNIMPSRDFNKTFYELTIIKP